MDKGCRSVVLHVGEQGACPEAMLLALVQWRLLRANFPLSEVPNAAMTALKFEREAGKPYGLLGWTGFCTFTVCRYSDRISVQLTVKALDFLIQLWDNEWCSVLLASQLVALLRTSLVNVSSLRGKKVREGWLVFKIHFFTSQRDGIVCHCRCLFGIY